MSIARRGSEIRASMRGIVFQLLCHLFQELGEGRGKVPTLSRLVVHADDLARDPGRCWGQVDAQRITAAVGREGNPAGVPPVRTDSLVRSARVGSELACVYQALPRIPLGSNLL